MARCCCFPGLTAKSTSVDKGESYQDGSPQGLLPKSRFCEVGAFNSMYSPLAVDLPGWEYPRVVGIASPDAG
jgi:hypothetical protein